MIAVDTNVLIYACDQADPRRQKIALSPPQQRYAVQLEEFTVYPVSIHVHVDNRIARCIGLPLPEGDRAPIWRQTVTPRDVLYAWKVADLVVNRTRCRFPCHSIREHWPCQ